MQPQITALFTELARRIQDLEDRLKKPDVELGHRSIFSLKKSGEVPKSPGGHTRVLCEDATWILPTGGNGGSGSNVGFGQPVLSGSDLTGTLKFFTLLGGDFLTITTEADVPDTVLFEAIVFPNTASILDFDVTDGTLVGNYYRFDDVEIDNDLTVIRRSDDAPEYLAFSGIEWDSEFPVIAIMNRTELDMLLLQDDPNSIPEHRISFPDEYGGVYTVAKNGSAFLMRNVDDFGADLQWQVLTDGMLPRLSSSLISLISSIVVSGSGEANTASNVGTGVQDFKQKVGVDLQFRTFSGSYLNGLTGTMIQNTNEIVIQTDAGPLSGTLNARILWLSGTVDGHFNALSGTINNAIIALSGALSASMSTLSGSVDGHFNALSGTINSAITAIVGGTGSSNIVHDQTMVGSGTIIFPLGVRNRSNVWDYPVVSHPLDDEFEYTGTIPDSWTISGSTPVTYGMSPYTQFATGSTRVDVSTKPSWLLLQPPGNSLGTFIFKKTLTLPTDFLVWGRFMTTTRALTNVASDGQIGIILGDSGSLDSTTNKLLDYVLLIIQNPTSATANGYVFFKSQGGVTTTIVQGEDTFVTRNVPQSYEAIGIQKIGTTYHAWGLDQGGSRTWISGTVWTGSLNYVGFYALNATNAQPGNIVSGIDFIRFVTGSNFLP